MTAQASADDGAFATASNQDGGYCEPIVTRAMMFLGCVGGIRRLAAYDRRGSLRGARASASRKIRYGHRLRPVAVERPLFRRGRRRVAHESADARQAGHMELAERRHDQ